MFNHACRICIVAALFATCGCISQTAIRNVADSLIAQPDPSVQLLESELRWMEDNIYRMDDQLETCLRQLESAKRNNAALRLELAERNNGTRSSHGPTLAAPSVTSGPTSGSESGSTDGFDEETNDVDDLLEFTSPSVELGERRSGMSPEEAKDDAAPASDDPAGPVAPKLESVLPQPKGEAPKIQPPNANPFLDDEDQSDGPAVSIESDQVTRILLNQRLTGGFNSDRKAGHDGVMVVIEPQDAYGQYSPVPGPVTIEVRDPTKSGIAGQVGKWHFSDSETQSLMKKTLMGKGIHIELPWPAGSPTTERLKLAVAYETPRGNKLTANQEIRIQPTTSALVTQAEDAEQRSWYSSQTPTASRWKPTR